MQEEIWKSITGYDGLYEVSSLGRIKRLEQYKYAHNQYGLYKRKMPEKILKTKKGTRKNKNKYLIRNNTPHRQGIVLIDELGLYTRYELSRLVALEFLPNPRNLPYVRIKDANPENCNVDNLEWSDKKNIHTKMFDELNYKIDEISKKDMSMSHKLLKKEWKCKKVKCIELNKIYNSMAEASRDINRGYDSIRIACNKKTKCAGYHWEYVE